MPAIIQFVNWDGGTQWNPLLTLFGLSHRLPWLESGPEGEVTMPDEGTRKDYGRLRCNGLR